VTFPEDYGVEDLAGKDAVFDVTVKEVSSADEIVVDDELATKLGLESLEKLKEAIKEQIGQDYDGFSQAKMKRALLDRLDEVHSFDVPTAMLDAEFDQVWHQYENHSGDKDKEDEGKSEDELKAEYREIAARRVRLGLLMSEVGRVNNITVDQDEVSRAIAERARQFPGQEQQLFEFYQKSPDALAQIRAPLFEDKVVNFITELAKITEESVSKADLMKDPDEDSEGDADKD
jgi:trigger factor